MQPLSSIHVRTEALALTKLEVWWYLLMRLGPHLPANFEQVTLQVLTVILRGFFFLINVFFNLSVLFLLCVSRPQCMRSFFLNANLNSFPSKDTLYFLGTL